jgi:hypothetical protein
MNDYRDISPNRSMFWLSVKWLAFGVALIAVFYFLILPLFVGGKLVGREAKKFDAETSAQVYDNSRQYQQGTNRDIARYCRDWQAAEGAARTAVADLILTTRDTYQGELTPANQACIAKIEGY